MADQRNTNKLGTGKRMRGATQNREDLSGFVFGKLPPQALPLEEAVLSAILLDKEALPTVVDILQAESFYHDAHQLIYRSMLQLFERSQPIDMLTVMEELKKAGNLDTIGGAAYLAELSIKVASAANIEFHARILSQKHIQRELITVSNKIIKDAYEDTTDVFDLLDEAEQGLFAIAERNMSSQVANMSSLASRLIKQLEELKDNEEGLTGVPTGFTSLDRLTSGLQRSDLIILAARPGMGKTAFVLSLARNAAVEFKKGVAIFSLEMSNLQLAQRLISMEAEIEGSKMRNGKLIEDEWKSLHAAVERVSDAPIFIDDTPGINVFELRAKCRRLKLQYDIQLIVIDYLQLMSGGNDNRNGNREQEVSAISRALKGLAKELNVPVIALSQLSRAVEVRGGNKKPQLSDLRESGCLTGDTLITLADTQQTLTLEEVVARYPYGGVSVWALDPTTYRLKKSPVSRAFTTGVQRVYEIVTAGGRCIRATANHKFMTPAGWCRLDELSPQDHLAVPQEDSLLTHAHYRATVLEYHGQADLASAPSAVMTDATAGDIHWDAIIDIRPAGRATVYDLTVPGLHNFVANGMVVHNSIEQDADIVAFIYRPEYYQIMEDEEGQSLKGVAEVIVAKHRHGALETVQLRFIDKYARFGNMDDPDFSALPGDVFEQSYQPIIAPSRMNDDEDIPF